MNQWKNLAPDIVRQRLIVECLTPTLAGPEEINNYLTQLSKVSQMQVLAGPFAYSAHELGWGGWIHWRTSGAHAYSYPRNPPNDPPLFTIDTYTCKPFAAEEVVEFTRAYFNALEIAWQQPQG